MNISFRFSVGETKYEFGKEDIILAIVFIIIIIGYLRGQLTIQEALTYMGVGTAGGFWGMVGGLASPK